jgi:uncharacterized membrane protein
MSRSSCACAGGLIDCETYLVLAVEEIARYGSDSARVHNRLRDMLDLHSTALPAHRGTIARQLSAGRTARAGPRARLSPSDVGLRPSSTGDSERL